MTPRGPDGTLQHRVWRTMKRLGPATAQTIADDLGLDREGVRKAVYYLILRGAASKERRGARAMFYAALGYRPPQDRRGKAPGSRNRAKNLGRVWALMMAKKHGENWRPKAVADPHPLAKAMRNAP